MRRLLWIGLFVILAAVVVYGLVGTPDPSDSTAPAGRGRAIAIPDARLIGRAFETGVPFDAVLAPDESDTIEKVWREEIRCRVVDEETGAPVPEALVKAIVRDPGRLASHADGLVRETLTDADGVARIPRCEVGAEYAVRKLGYFTRFWTAPQGGETRIVLRPGRPFRGRVQDTDGLPVVGATVWPDALGIRWWRCDLPQVTDEEGCFTVAAVADPPFLVFHVAHSGYGTRRVEHWEMTWEELVITLGAGAVIEGRVVDEDGRVVAGAAVTVDDPDNWWALRGKPSESSPLRPLSTRAITDEHGRYLIRGAESPSERRVIARTPDERVGWSGIVAVSEASSRREVVVRVKRMGAIAVSCTDAATGERIEPGRVRCTLGVPWKWTNDLESSRTDNRRGVASFDFVPPGRHTVNAACYCDWPEETHLRPPPVEVEVRPGKETHVAFALERGHTVRGRLVDGTGSPRKGNITFESTWRGVKQRASTSAFGTFQLTGVPAARGCLRVFDIEQAERIRLVQEDVELPDDLGDLVLPRAPSVRGRISSTLSLLDLRVHVEGEDLYRSVRLDLDEDCAFHLLGLPPGEPFRLAFASSESTALVIERVVLAAGEVRDLGELVFPPVVVVEGRVLDAEGRPVEDAGVQRIGKHAVGGRRTDADGRFRLRRESSGVHNFGVWRESRPLGFFAVEVHEEMEPVTLRLPQPGRLQLVVHREDGDTLPSARVTLRPQRADGSPDPDREVELIADGHGRLDTDLPPGHWGLRVRRRNRPEWLAEASVEIRTGESTSVPLSVP